MQNKAPKPQGFQRQPQPEPSRPLPRSFAPERRCADCFAFVPEDKITGDCKLNPLAVRKYASDWCGQFAAK